MSLSLAEISYLQGYADGYFARAKSEELVEPDAIVKVIQSSLNDAWGHTHKLTLNIESESWGPCDTTHRFNSEQFDTDKQKSAIERMCRRTLQCLPEIREKLRKEVLA